MNRNIFTFMIFSAQMSFALKRPKQLQSSRTERVPHLEISCSKQKMHTSTKEKENEKTKDKAKR